MKTRIKVTTYESGRVTYTPQYYKERKFLWLDLSGWLPILNDDGYVLGEYEVFCSQRDTIEEAQVDITTYLRSVKDKIVTDTDYVGYP